MDAVLRIEVAREDDTFCDEQTFLVRRRKHSGTLDWFNTQQGETTIRFGRFELSGSGVAESATEFFRTLKLEKSGAYVWRAENDVGLRSSPPQPDRLPSPSKADEVWVLHDSPRTIPPEWGSLPPPGQNGHEDAGWLFEPEARDVYLFLHENLHELYRLMIGLTGPVPLPPLWSFGFWHSRYHPYDENAVRDVIDRYRAGGFPLDVFVMDTDWRTGGSRGYDINSELFPDIERVFHACSQRGVRTLLNDHPEPRGLLPMDPALFQYRYDNLARLIDMGLDTWWFDRNWPNIIQGPVPGIETSVWGQALYWDIISSRRPEQRTVLLSMSSPHPATHRYPIWWTGDNESDWAALSGGVQDSIEEGLQLRPYTGQDIGGHVGYPSPEQFVRWMQWGAVAPTLRLHSGPHNRVRYPWRYGEAALRSSRDYVRLRYRLLPLLYTLSRQAHDTGIPMLRSMELDEPAAPAWACSRQFMLGDDLLVAPVLEPSTKSSESLDYLRFSEPLQRQVWFEPSWSRQQLRDEDVPQGAPCEVGYDEEIRIDSLNWSEKLTAWKPGFYALWTGSFEVPEDGWYLFRLQGNGRKSLLIDEDRPAQLIGAFDTGNREVTLHLSASCSHSIRLTFLHSPLVQPSIRLIMGRVPEIDTLSPVHHRMWVPPGGWRDLWTGEEIYGPATITRRRMTHQLPVLARHGGIVPLGSIPEHTGEAIWSPVTWEIFVPHESGARDFTLYEDDGTTLAYLDGMWAKTTLQVQWNSRNIVVKLGPPVGALVERVSERIHFLRVNLPRGATVRAVAAAQFELPEVTSPPDEDSRRAWWYRLSPARDSAQMTPLALVPEAAGQPNGTTLLIRLVAVSEIRIEVQLPDGQATEIT